jgi:hypothetical protein
MLEAIPAVAVREAKVGVMAEMEEMEAVTEVVETASKVVAPIEVTPHDQESHFAW